MTTTDRKLLADEHLRSAIDSLVRAGNLLADDPDLRGSRLHYTLEVNLDSLMMLREPLLAEAVPQGSC